MTLDAVAGRIQARRCIFRPLPSTIFGKNVRDGIRQMIRIVLPGCFPDVLSFALKSSCSAFS